VSKHGALSLATSEEAVDVDFSCFIKDAPISVRAANPITEYFRATESLKAKIIHAAGSGDSELFGLLTIGIISAVEFYLRSVFSSVPLICPLARRHIEMATVPIGAIDFYALPGASHLAACFDHESLADGEKIKKLCEKFTGLKIATDGSAAKTIDDFGTLCEIRHCLVHTRGNVGLKASNALSLSSRVPSRVVITTDQALTITKLSHNVTRAINRFVSDGIVSRWVDNGLLVGDWDADKVLFTPVVRFFEYSEESAQATNVYRRYLPFRKAALSRLA